MRRLAVVILTMLACSHGLALANELSDLQTELQQLVRDRNQAALNYESQISELKKQASLAKLDTRWVDKETPRLLAEPRLYDLVSDEFNMVMRYDVLLPLDDSAEDTWGITARFEWPLNKNMSVAGDIQYLFRQKYPFVPDAKGDLGDIRGIGGLVNLIYRFPYSKNLSPYAIGGVGVFGWEFHENPFLQDRKATISLDPSFAYRLGGGLDWQLGDEWALNFEAAYFDTDISREVQNATGREDEVLGSGAIDNAQFQISIGLRYRFS